MSTPETPQSTTLVGCTPAALLEIRAQLVAANLILSGPDFMTPRGTPAHANARAAIRMASDRLGRMLRDPSDAFDGLECVAWQTAGFEP